MEIKKEHPGSSNIVSEKAKEALLIAIDTFKLYSSVGDENLKDEGADKTLKEVGVKLTECLGKAIPAIKGIEGEGAEWGERLELLNSIFKTLRPEYAQVLSGLVYEYLEQADDAIFPAQNRHAKEPATDMYKSSYKELRDDAELSDYMLALTKNSAGKEGWELREESWRLYNLSKNVYMKMEKNLDKDMEDRIEQIKDSFLIVFKNTYPLNEIGLQSIESKLGRMKKIDKDIVKMFYDVSIKGPGGLKEVEYAFRRLEFINGKVRDAEGINRDILGLKDNIELAVLGEDSEKRSEKLGETIHNELSNFITLFDSKARDITLEAVDGLYRELQKTLVDKRGMIEEYMNELMLLEQGELQVFKARRVELLEDAKAMNLDTGALLVGSKYLR